MAFMSDALRERLRLFSSEAESLSSIYRSTMANDNAQSERVYATHHISESSFRSKAPTLRPKIPVEILDKIFSYTSEVELKALLITNSFISALATRRLYHDVILTRPRAIVAFLLSVLANDHFAIIVRSLDINITKPKPKNGQIESLTARLDPDRIDSLSRPVPTLNFYTLLQRALRRMKGLAFLSIELPKRHDAMWIFDGCTFRLRQFTTSMYCRRPLAQFLESQPTITDLTLRGYQASSMTLVPFMDSTQQSQPQSPSDQFVLAPDALPNLRTFNAVHADATLVHCVVHGRPVEIVSVPLFPDKSIATLDALSSSSMPLRRLSVISFDPAAPDFLFDALRMRFMDLEALHLVILMAEYSQEMLEQTAPLLTNFRRLKYITFMAAPASPSVVPPNPIPAAASAPNATTANPAPSTTQNNTPANVSNADATTGTSAATTWSRLDAGEADVAKQWHRACPTLRTIILPQGRVWFQSAAENRDEDRRHHEQQQQASGGSNEKCGAPAELPAESDTQTGVATEMEWVPL